MSYFRSHLLSAFIVLETLSTAFAQNLSEFNFIYPDSSLIKANGIKSLLVISDFAEDGIEQSTFTTTNKWMEFAFNENGQRFYVRTYPMFQEYGILGNISSKWQWFTYDAEQRIKSAREKTEKNDYGINCVYNSDDQLKELTTEHNGILTGKHVYTWKNGEAEKVEFITLQENEFHEERIFNKDGTLKRIKSDFVDIQLNYTSNDSILTTKTEWFKDGERQFYMVTSLDERINRTIYSLRIDKNQDTSSIIQARYDSKGNMTYFKKLDFSNRRNYVEYSPPIKNGNGETIPPTKNPIPDPFTVHYRITNEYDSSELLIKQHYFKINEKKSTEIHTATIYLIYGTSELIIQPLPLEEEDEEFYYLEGDY